MTKTLQKKFIVTAMIAVTVLLVLLLGGLNVMNAVSSANESERLLHMLSFERSFSDGPPDFNAAPPEGEDPRRREDVFQEDAIRSVVTCGRNAIGKQDVNEREAFKDNRPCHHCRLTSFCSVANPCAHNT